MKHYILRDRHLIEAALPADREMIERTILENNEGYSFYRDTENTGTVVICENKPNNIRNFFGIIWEEFDD